MDIKLVYDGFHIELKEVLTIFIRIDKTFLFNGSPTRYLKMKSYSGQIFPFILYYDSIKNLQIN